MLLLSSRDRRALQLGLAVVTALVVFGRGCPAWRRWEGATRAAAEESVETTARLEAAVRTSAAVRDSATARTARFSGLRDSVIVAPTHAEAGATLAAALSELTDNEAVRVLSMSIRGQSNGLSSRRVAVRLSFVTDTDGLVRVLRRLEGDALFLAVRELSVEHSETGKEAQAGELRIELVVEAVAITGAPLATVVSARMVATP